MTRSLSLVKPARPPGTPATEDDHVEHKQPRLTSVMGVARALITTIGVEDAVEVLVLEFGWDLSFQALALMRDEDANRAFGMVWEHLLTAPFAADLRSAWSRES